MTSPVLISFCVTYGDGREPVVVTAERCEQQGRHWVFWGSHTVMNRSRAVVVLRVSVAEVARIAVTASP